jgi:predicted nucleic acid-binding protein
MIYCDTSLLVAALTPELANDRVQRWLRTRENGELCVSAWVTTEISSALAMKLRRGDLSLDQRASVLDRWHDLLDGGIISIEIPAQAWVLATTYCDRHEVNIRAGDALHLAIATLGGHSVATLDVAMADAAVAIGIPIERVST